jgi:methylase of polypeptide subunit release factors
LFAAKDGAAEVLRLLETAPSHLNGGGRLLAEVDPAIVATVSEGAGRACAHHTIHRDLGGHERVIEAWY